MEPFPTPGGLSWWRKKMRHLIGNYLEETDCRSCACPLYVGDYVIYNKSDDGVPYCSTECIPIPWNGQRRVKICVQ